MRTNRLEGSDLAWLGRDVVYEDTTLCLCAELVVELQAKAQVSNG